MNLYTDIARRVLTWQPNCTCIVKDKTVPNLSKRIICIGRIQNLKHLNPKTHLYVKILIQRKANLNGGQKIMKKKYRGGGRGRGDKFSPKCLNFGVKSVKVDPPP